MVYEYVPCSATMRDTVENVMMQNQEHVEGESINVDPTFDQGFSEDADISGFLERPVKIRSYTWAVGAPFAESFNPWALFLANDAVRDKLANYSMLRGSLKVTFMINGTPQHAGLILASYAYLDMTNEVSLHKLITRSQRPHIYLNPSLSRGGCLCLPFYWGQNYINLNDSASSARRLGRINLDSFQDLTQLNGATDNVTVSVFAHMTDVVLTVPTFNAVPASGRGRSSRKISMTDRKSVV